MGYGASPGQLHKRTGASSDGRNHVCRHDLLVTSSLAENGLIFTAAGYEVSAVEELVSSRLPVPLSRVLEGLLISVLESLRNLRIHVTR